MMAEKALIGLIAYFVVCAIISIAERNLAMILYNAGAALLNLGILLK